jgi:class 3 adenylate cyclase/ligand-binding sensor protein
MEQPDLDRLNIQSLEDLIDEDYIKKMQNDFARSTGIEIILAGIRNPMAFMKEESHFYFCNELKKNADFAGNCQKITREAIGIMQGREDILVIPCHIGFLKFGSWITVMGKRLGILAGCKVVPHKKLIKKKRCKNICKEYNYNGDWRQMYKSLKEYPVFSEKELVKTLDFFKVMSNTISEIAKTKYQLKLEDEKRNNIAKYFSPDVYNRIESHANEESYKCRATILFSDIRNFVSTGERLSPEELVEMLNEYFELMVDIVFQHNGSLDTFIGDAILAVFGMSAPEGQNETNALMAASHMMDAIDHFNTKRQQAGKEAINIGIGIHTGEIIAGNIGSSKRSQYTVIGDTVNVASRLEALSKEYPEKIIISEDVYSAVKDMVDISGIEEVKLKGKSHTTRIFRVKKIRV